MWRYTLYTGHVQTIHILIDNMNALSLWNILLTFLFKVDVEAGILVAFLLVSQHYEAPTERCGSIAVL